MKKIYSKPLIFVEELTLDQPNALTCNARKAVMETLLGWSYFNNDRGCDYLIVPGPDGTGAWVDSNFDGVGDFENGMYDTLCYNSNVETAFLS